MSKYALFYTKIFGNKTVTSQTTYCSRQPNLYPDWISRLSFLLCSIAPGYKVEGGTSSFPYARTRTSAFTFPSGDCTMEYSLPFLEDIKFLLNNCLISSFWHEKWLQSPKMKTEVSKHSFPNLSEFQSIHSIKWFQWYLPFKRQYELTNPENQFGCPAHSTSSSSENGSSVLNLYANQVHQNNAIVYPFYKNFITIVIFIKKAVCLFWLARMHTIGILYPFAVIKSILYFAFSGSISRRITFSLGWLLHIASSESEDTVLGPFWSQIRLKG
jgi:hypothetical protein